jgi:hypothetical protein
MKGYLKAFLIGGVAFPLTLHLIAPAAMPWWPDTASVGMVAGAVAIAFVWKSRVDREMNRRMRKVIKAIVRRPDSY